jgi:menaquinone reductase, integral membrane subunit
LKALIKMIIKEFMSYSKSVRIALYIMFFLAAGFIVFGIQILFWGLGYTDMSNAYPFGLWIIGDLGLVALGGGAFATGFTFYICRRKNCGSIINSTVLLGFLCYLFTLVFLVLDIGQPLRAWFGYIYPNWGNHIFPNSMMTEVIWCLSIYFLILCIEMTPIVLKHKILDKIPVLNKIGHTLHNIMWIFAAIGTFLSFFHQGSLGGGLWGSLYAKASWFRPHFFFLAIVGAVAGGTSFMSLCAYLAGKVTKRELVQSDTFWTMTKISGYMYIFYIIFRLYDIISLSIKYVPSFDRRFADIIGGGYYGWWMIVLELIFAIVAVIFLLNNKIRSKENYFLLGVGGGTLSIVMAKLSTVLNGSSVPNFPWEKFASYNPTIQEWFIMLGGLSIMAMIYMWCVKYLPLFPNTNTCEADRI